MNKLALAVCVALVCSPAMAKRNIVVVDGDKINVVADPRGQGKGVRDNPKACMQSALACAPVTVVDPPAPPVVQPPVVQPPVVQPPVVQPPVVQPPVVQPPTTQPPVVVPPTVTPPVVQPPVVVPPTVTPPTVTPPVVTPPVVQPPAPGLTVTNQRVVPCVKDWGQCKFGQLTENRAEGSVIDEVIYYDFK